MSELWRFDLSTHQWIFLNTSKWGTFVQPPAREQHSALVIQGDLYIFGGKARIFSVDPDTGQVLTNEFHSDVVYSDMWKLSVPRPLPYIMMAGSPSSSSLAIIPQSGRHNNKLQGSLNETIMSVSHESDPRSSYCIEKVIIKVS